MAESKDQEALNPIHPSVLPHLDPAFIDLYTKHIANVPNKPIDLALLRKNYSTLYSYATGPAPECGRIWDSEVPASEGVKVSVRVYEPLSEGPWPVHVDFHGGGWALGDLDTESHICKHICVKANVAVIDIAYRLIPDHPFPIGIQDSFAALQYIHAHGRHEFNINPTRISIGGISAGATIALICAHLSRDHDIPLNLVVAGTPTIDDISKYSTAQASPFSSIREMEYAPTLNWTRLKWFDDLKWKSLSDDPEVRETQMRAVSWYANALDAPSFMNLPKTVIYTAGCDPLRDEGEAYARKLIEAGNEVVQRRFVGVPHPFVHMDRYLWQAREYIDKTATEIRIALHEV